MIHIKFNPTSDDMKKAALQPFKRNPITYVIILVCAIQAIKAIGGLLGLFYVERLSSAVSIGIFVPIALFLIFRIAFSQGKKTHKTIEINMDEESFCVLMNSKEKDESRWERAINIKETKSHMMIYIMAYYCIPLPKQEIININQFKIDAKACKVIKETKFT